MKFLYALLLSVIGLPLAFAQETTAVSLMVLDTAVNARDTTFGMLQDGDSIAQRITIQGLDELTLSRANETLDAIHADLTERIDSLRKRHSSAVQSLQKARNSMALRIDSLLQKNLPTDEQVEKLDSISNNAVSLVSQLEGDIHALRERALAKLDATPVPQALQQQASKLKSWINGLDQKSPIQQLSINDQTTALRGLSQPKAVDLSGLTSAVPTTSSRPDIPVTSDLPGGTEQLKGVLTADKLDLSSQLGQTTDMLDTQHIKSGNEFLQGFQGKSIDEMAEQQLGGLQPVKQIQDEARVAGLDAIKSEEAMKAELQQRATAEAVDHFAGKEEKLNAAIAQMARIKSRHSSIRNLAEAAAKPRNPMKEKKLVERIVPGVVFYVQRKGDDIILDYNPYAGYRFSRRVTGGGGWNQRFAYSLKDHAFSSRDRIFGPRMFGEFALSRGFSPRLEVEAMSVAGPGPSVAADRSARQWVWGSAAGIKKEYTVFRQLKGTALVMVRLLAGDQKHLYASVITARFGFEIPLKTSRNSKSQNVTSGR